MPQWVELARFQSLTDLANAGQGLDDTVLAQGDQAVVQVQFPIDASGWVGPIQAACDAAGLHMWGPVTSDGVNLYIPVQKQSPAIVAVAAILLSIAALIAVGLLLFIVYKLVTEGNKFLADNIGWMVLAGLGLLVLPGLLLRDSSGSRATGLLSNPIQPLMPLARTANPVDTTALLQLVGLGVLGAGGYALAKQGQLPVPLQQFFHDVFPSIPVPGSLPGAIGPGAPAPGQVAVGDPNAPASCHPLQVGNTHISLQVNPWNPVAQEGAAVTFNGRVTRNLFGAGWLPSDVPVSGARVEFWQPGQCSAAFAAVNADGGGNYTYTRPLQADELAGYYVQARYAGGAFDFGATSLDPATTGLWHVVPGG